MSYLKRYKKIIFVLYTSCFILLLWACSAPKKEAQNRKDIDLSKIRIDTVKYTAQDSINYALYEPIKSELWDTLRNIKYTKEGAYGHVPTFTDKHKALHGKEITIEGYMHPIDPTDLQKWFMLSYYPSNACFFCGAAGPETAIEVKSPKGIIYKRDKRITIKGKIYMNYDEPERLFYIMEGAELQ
jgi:hypothetical protein